MNKTKIIRVTSCYDCMYQGPNYKGTKWCMQIGEPITNYVNNETYHPDCPLEDYNL
ncbi:MAG: hypothetical protein ACOCUI_00340 [bacterium]